MKRSTQNISSAISLAIASATLLLAGTASMAATNPAVSGRENDSDCVFFRSIHDWRALDATHMVVWAPGNHELWTPREDPVQLRGDHRYQHLVTVCRDLGVLTPEDPYAVWDGPGGPATVVPLFLLYDYTFLPDGVSTKEEALAAASKLDGWKKL